METKNKEDKLMKKDRVHFILLNSYLMFLFTVILGVIFDIITKVRIFSGSAYQYVGLFLIFIGTIVIYWAQATSKNYKNKIEESHDKSHFEFGPYRYLRSPTHFGLLIVTLGFGLMINSLFSIIFTLVGYMISKTVFLRKEELLLEKKYGEQYTKYKEKVKNWI